MMLLTGATCRDNQVQPLQPFSVPLDCASEPIQNDMVCRYV